MIPALVILDLGATLVTGPPRGPWSRIAASLGLDPQTNAVLRDALMTRRFECPDQVATFLAPLAAAPLEDVRAAVAEVWAAQSEEAQPIPGAEQALERLAAGGVELGVISNIWSPYLESVRAHFGAFLDAHVPAERQLFSYRAGRAKPAPALFEDVVRAAGVAAEAVVMVGDSYVEDIEPAAHLGMGTIWVLHRPEREREALARVLSGDGPPPARAIPQIAGLTMTVLESALERRRGLVQLR